jgi:YbbR domain-containing protein
LAKQGSINSPGIKNRLMRGKISAFVICLLISGFLWISHTLNRSYSYSFYIPVRFVNLPANKTLLSDLPSSLRFDVRTSGLKLLFALLNRPFPEIIVDFNTLKGDNKSQTYAISSGNINIKSCTKVDVDVKRISPDTLYFAAKKGLNKNVPIKPVVFASADKGFIASRPLVNPSYITINGDSASLAGIDSISTVPLYLSQLTGNYVGKLSLVSPSDNVYLSLNEVNISIQTDKLLEKEIEVPLAAINCKDNCTPKLFPSKVKVRFSSAGNDFKDIDQKSFKAVVDLAKQKKDSNKLPVELSTLPTGAHILSIEPQEVEFLLFRK